MALNVRKLFLLMPFMLIHKASKRVDLWGWSD